MGDWASPEGSGLALIGLKFYNVCSLQAFRAVRNIKTHGLAFRECLETCSLDCGVMNENVCAIFLGYEPKTLGIIKPLNSSLCHAKTPP